MSNSEAIGHPGLRRRVAGKRLSTPQEHGGLVILAGGVLLAALAAPRPVLAALAAAVYVAAYLARGPIERRVRRARPRPWDRAALLVYAAAAAAIVLALATVGPWGALAVAATATVIPVAGAIAVRARRHRDLAVELVGLGACGGAAGVAVYAAGGAEILALTVIAAGAVYGAATAPLVRSELRRELELPARRDLAGGAFLILAVGAAITAAFVPLAALALAPRVLHAAYRVARPGRSPSRTVLITREVISLALFVLLLAALS
jgi:membrane associated rhomboid family serine protease